jgi:hypothetical protein
MNRKLFLLVLASTVAALAENPLTDSVMTRYKRLRLDVSETAEVMPEQNYSFRLTPAQRTFAEWIGHAAMGNFGFCAAIKGEAAPKTEHIHHMTGKSEHSKALLDSFNYCDEALKGMTDQKALTAYTLNSKQGFPVQGMINLVSSTNEHYGNMVGYLRVKGITPPSTVRASKKK